MAFAWWTLAAGANGALAILYLLIAFLIVRGLWEGRQWRSNPIGVATGGIFVTCGIGHGLHVLHVVPPLSLLDPVAAADARLMFGDWRLLLWDAATAGVAIWYWALRSRLAIVYEGAALCEDMVARQERAALLQEKIVAGLERTRTALDEGRREAGLRALQETLDESRTIITMLLGSERHRRAIGPGDLRRQAASR